MSPSSPGNVEPREESGAATANSSLNAATNGTLNATLPGTSFSGPPWPELNLSYSSWAAIICGVVVFWILLSLFLAYFFGPDFVTVTKGENVEWDHIKPAILGVIMEHYQSGQPVMKADAAQAGHADHDGPDSEIVNQIKELLDTRVRPAVAQDGGDITFHGFDRGVVYLHMQGACAGCPSSTITLKMGIENLLRHYIPEVTEVRPVAA